MLYGLLLVKLRQSFAIWQIIVLTARCYAERSIAMASCLWVIPFEMGHSHPGDHLQIA